MISKKTKQRKPIALSEEELEDLVDEIVGDGLEEGIFGDLGRIGHAPIRKAQHDVDRSLNAMERGLKALKKPKKPKKRSPHKPRALLPKMQINKPSTPKDAKFIDIRDIANAVSVPESTLRRIAANVESNTEKVNDLLLTNLIPLMLSYDTGTNYAKAALRDGLNIEIDFDAGLADAVKCVGYLNVLNFFVSNSTLDDSIKRRFMLKLSDNLSMHTLQSLIEGNRVHDKQVLAQDLQAVVYSGTRRKATVHRASDKDQDDKQKPSRQNTNTKQPMAASRRRAT